MNTSQALEKIGSQLPCLDNVVKEAVMCIRKGMIESYKITMTPTMLKIIVYGDTTKSAVTYGIKTHIYKPV